jgi:hypothetical protein
MSRREIDIGDCFYKGKALQQIRQINNRLREREGKPTFPYQCSYDHELITSNEYEMGHLKSIKHESAVRRRTETLIGRTLKG